MAGGLHTLTKKKEKKMNRKRKKIKNSPDSNHRDTHDVI